MVEWETASKIIEILLKLDSLENRMVKVEEVAFGKETPKQV